MKLVLPKISIITIVLNNRSFLEYTIESVMNQSYKNIEYIVIDGGSTDGSVELIKSYGKRIQKWVSEKDSGIYNAINKGIKLATGDWICILNAGDRLASQNTISEIFTESISDKTQIIYGDWYLCDLRKSPNEFTQGFANLEKGYLLHQSMFYRAFLHKTRGPYIETKKLIISDYIFFRTIPEINFQYKNIPIAINDNSGISSQSWSLEQKVAFDFIIGKVTFYYMVKRILLERSPKFIKRMIHLLLSLR